MPSDGFTSADPSETAREAFSRLDETLFSKYKSAITSSPRIETGTLANPGRGKGKTWNHHTNDLTTRSKAGTSTGFIDSEVPNVKQWLGVPYCAPSIGDQRFLPHKPAAYAGEVATTTYKPICMQNGGPDTVVFFLGSRAEISEHGSSGGGLLVSIIIFGDRGRRLVAVVG